MNKQPSTHPVTYAALGAAAAAKSLLGLPPVLRISVLACALVFVLLRRRPRGPHLGAFVGGGGTILLSPFLLPLTPELLLLVLAAIGVVVGVILGWRSVQERLPGFHFFREDFLEFCGFVGLLAAFPVIPAMGFRGAGELAGQYAFELAVLGACVLLPLTATAYSLCAARRVVRRPRVQVSDATPAVFAEDGLGSGVPLSQVTQATPDPH